MSVHKEELKKIDSSDQKIQYLNGIEFPVCIEKDNKTVTLSIPNLKIKESGSSVDELLAKIEIKKKNYFSEMVKIDAEDEICFPPKQKPAGLSDLFKGLIAIVLDHKTAVVYLFCLLVTVQTCSTAKKGIIKSKNRLAEKMQENIENTSPRKLKERQSRLGKYLNFIKPYYIQIKEFEAQVTKETELKNR